MTRDIQLDINTLQLLLSSNAITLEIVNPTEDRPDFIKGIKISGGPELFIKGITEPQGSTIRFIKGTKKIQTGSIDLIKGIKIQR
jgi:hypothetical protein